MSNLEELYGGDMEIPEESSESSYGPISPGIYIAEVEAAEIKPNSKNTGVGLKLQLSIIGEKHNGRKVFNWINISNPSQKSTAIGKEEMGRLCIACGLPKLPRDSDAFLGKYVRMRVKTRKDDPNDSEVQDFLPPEDAVQQPTQAATPPSPPVQQAQPQQPTAPATPPQQQPAQSTGKLPWEK